jgi:N6-L-threonylcarbamoyladenine synthase
MTNILGLETSCDETAAAVVSDGREVRSNVVSSQIAKHAPYGGVVPEIAAREHLHAIGPVTEAALREAGLTFGDIDAVAVTNGPGLMPALLVGINFARGLAAGHSVPLIPVNHFFAHIYGSFLECGPEELERESAYPILALVVSGGHTSLLLIQSDGSAKTVGQTLDDAAGEAFDKAAKLLNLGYPGGPILDRLAKQGNPARFPFPRPLVAAPGRSVAEQNRFHFSFSGVKTALLYHCRGLGGGDSLEQQILYDTVASYQEAIVDVLDRKTADAAVHFGARRLVLCGGVACNSALRARFLETSKTLGIPLVIAPPKYCTDNAAMVAGIAWKSFHRDGPDIRTVDAFSRLPEISSIWSR